MLQTILMLIHWIIAQVMQDNDLMLKIFIPTGSVSGTMFLIWYYTFKQNKKDYANALKQNQEQFQFALTQNQKQFDRAMEQMERHHKENLMQNRETIDRVFKVMEKDSEYKEILTGVLIEIKEKIK